MALGPYDPGICMYCATDKNMTSLHFVKLTNHVLKQPYLTLPFNSVCICPLTDIQENVLFFFLKRGFKQA